MLLNCNKLDLYSQLSKNGCHPLLQLGCAGVKRRKNEQLARDYKVKIKLFLTFYKNSFYHRCWCF